MRNVLDIAAYIFDKYKEISDTTIDEMKLHKLLYFAQRQSLTVFAKPLFDDDFQAWKYGPVCVSVRSNYTEDGILKGEQSNITGVTKNMLDDIISVYGAVASWKLSELSHEEISWRNARVGLQPNDYGDQIMSLEDIKADGIKSLENKKVDDITLNISDIEVINVLPADWDNPEDVIYEQL